MGSPESDGGDSEEDVLTWTEIPWSCRCECDFYGVSREVFHQSLCSSCTDVTVDKDEKTDGSLRVC